MNGFPALFQPDFLLYGALWGSVAVGVFCPLVGVYLMLRRMTLMGVALPQISAAGIALVFCLEGLGLRWSLHAGENGDRFLALLGSLIFTYAALAVLAWLERRGKGSPESRVGAAFALAYALSILWVSSNPQGKIETLGMLHGEIVTVTRSDLHLLLGGFTVLGALLWALHPQFLLVSFDRESARVQGKNVALWDILLLALAGTAVAMSTLIVGPMLTFAQLVLPPLAARRFCRRMPPFFLLSALFGGTGGLLGFYVSYRLDWPLGPTEIAVSAALAAAAFSVDQAFRRLRAA